MTKAELEALAQELTNENEALKAEIEALKAAALKEIEALKAEIEALKATSPSTTVQRKAVLGLAV